MKINLSGYVVPDSDAFFYRFFGIQCFSPRDVRNAVGRAEDADDELMITLNSGGGSVFAGFEMYSVLSSAKIPTTVQVQSIAGSAASVLMLGADRIEMSPVAEVMIHLPSTTTDGDENDHAKSIEILRTITESILNAYEARCAGKVTRDDLRVMVNSETWMTAQQAIDNGFADALINEGSSIDPASIAAAAGSMPDIGKLRATYMQAHPEGVPSEDGAEKPCGPAAEAAADKARRSRVLAIEKVRYGGIK